MIYWRYTLIDKFILKGVLSMKKVNAKVLGAIAAAASVFAALIASSACFFFIYQPEEPKSLRDE